jgi:hypothetical protein
MNDESVSLKISGKLYERAKQMSAESNRPVEAVLMDSLNLLFGVEDEDIQLDDITNLSDEQLWGIVHQRLAWPQETRLRELTALGKQNLLSEDEQAELEQLIDRVDRYTLLRSQALLLLKQRGYDVEQRLRLGA